MLCGQFVGTELAICGFDCVNSDESVVEEYAAYNPIQQGVFSAKELLPKIVQTNGWAYVVPWNKLYHRNLIDSSFSLLANIMRMNMELLS